MANENDFSDFPEDTNFIPSSQVSEGFHNCSNLGVLFPELPDAAGSSAVSSLKFHSPTINPASFQFGGSA